ncbi:hypothetical protein EXIGLDRAFT_786697 [Exidia glandulosa HHB12029]|uniref:Uncharacterized protein n=1 Tax=Exidia glandulosa HHB12029 TaxID=1314781 RepID=A0A165P908_EXIGL|nr:hypothetical protein EXIGLDRAFT_786697 [Exidia glandulosa HHB12029]
MSDTTPGIEQVLCTCKRYGCRTRQAQTPDGHTVSGQYVSKSTRTLHRQRDTEPEGAASTSAFAPTSASGSGDTSWLSRKRPRSNDDTHSGDHKAKKPKTVAATPLQLTPRTILLSLLFAAWLHLCCGLSREQAQAATLLLQLILREAVGNPKVNLHHDVRTAMSTLSLEPTIFRSACCPKCFMKYDLADIPELCTRRETRRSQPCNEPLLMRRHTPVGPKQVPRRLYSMQSFDDWLVWFLSRPKIVEAIKQSYQHVPSLPGGTMYGIWDSPAWTALGGFTRKIGNLTFSIFIDWFNPLSNRLAGKKISCRAIQLCCLNLPLSDIFLPENIFIAGTTPMPHEPTVTTISHVVEPVVDTLVESYTGKPVPVHGNPKGWKDTAVAVIPLQGDVLGCRKAGGQAGHSADQFCAWCHLLLHEIERLDIENWLPRTDAEVRSAAWQWRASGTKKEREKIFKASGARWSELHRLEYRRHVQFTVLGVMHNWFEGVLQDHLRRFWGLGKIPTRAELDAAIPSTASDPVALDDEIAQLLDEQAAHPQSPIRPRARLAQTSRDADVEMADADDDCDFVPDDASESDCNDDEFESDAGGGSTLPTFDETQLAAIRRCIANIVLPTDVERPPTNLGEASHGKLKAALYFTLFADILPMILVELWWKSPTRTHEKLLSNFYDLVTATNVVGSYSTSNAAADRYLAHYIRYRESKRELWPHLRSRPNDHYAMHNAAQLKFWGPLMPLSEFPYERINGEFQGFNTNGHMYDMDYTMLRQICRRSRLAAQVKGRQYDDTVSDLQPSSVLFRSTRSVQSSSAQRQLKAGPRTDLDPEQEAKTRASGTPLAASHYDLLLAYLNSRGSSWKHALHGPHSFSDAILPTTAEHKRTCTFNNHGFSIRSVHMGQASVQLQSQDQSGNAYRWPGLISTIFNICLEGAIRTFFVVDLHAPLSAEDNAKNPFAILPGFQIMAVYAHFMGSVIVEPHEVFARVAFYDRPGGTFDIERPIRLLRVLDRGRRSMFV